MGGAVAGVVTYKGCAYRLDDLAYYMDDETREAVNDDWTGADDDAQGWWDEYVRRYPDHAENAAGCAPPVSYWR